MMIFNRKPLFDGLRKDFGKFDDVQVSVIAAMVDEFERRKLPDVRWLAYMLATAYHEALWRPVREIGRGKGKPYGKMINGKIYYGRGLVQITWIENYRELGRILNLPLVDEPDMALIVPVAVGILYEGMTTALSAKGDFTGRDLSQFFNATTDDPVNARRIVNGVDKAKLIAGHHAKILKVLQAAVRVEPVVEPVRHSKPAAEIPQLDVSTAEGKMQKGIASLLVAIAAAIGLGLLAVVAFFMEK